MTNHKEKAEEYLQRAEKLFLDYGYLTESAQNYLKLSKAHARLMPVVTQGVTTQYDTQYDSWGDEIGKY